MRTSLYPAVDELERTARTLVRAAPALLRLSQVGQSREGRPLWLLSAGHGDRHILTVSGAHANEPVGGDSALRLAALFSRRPACSNSLTAPGTSCSAGSPTGRTSRTAGSRRSRSRH
ncbi:M14 family zinc carboxypeptidase [Streptomyces sp. NPDC102270]|uniref:M14 family zinc carboxypeptidase n=1 Tax=Streptomyces sp. NPDC102270 TaxID=3366150 RepID=UPI0037FCE3EC